MIASLCIHDNATNNKLVLCILHVVKSENHLIEGHYQPIQIQSNVFYKACTSAVQGFHADSIKLEPSLCYCCGWKHHIMQSLSFVDLTSWKSKNTKYSDLVTYKPEKHVDRHACLLMTGLHDNINSNMLCAILESRKHSMT